MMDYTIGFIKINKDQEEFPLLSVTISNEKNVNEQTTFTKYLFTYLDNNQLKEFSIQVTPAIHII